MKKKLSLMVTLLLMLTLFPYAVHGEDNVFELNNLNDWNKLVKLCVLDTNSEGLTVNLNADLDFKDGFTSIPYFNGTFNGNNHKLVNIALDSDETNVGVFRITGKKADVNNVNVEYSVDSKANNLGFIGYNQGKVSNINVDSKVLANSDVGMVVGYNASGASIIDCQSYGDIYGKHYVGGIVGVNYGLVKNCFNRARVNDYVLDDNVDINAISLDTLKSSENVASITDIGGVVGSNFGSVKTCVNYSIVGYEHVGYNIGGVCGSHSGYIESCVNYGEVYGRKEVGGIVGQFEPCMELDFNEDYLQRMQRQIKSVSSSVDASINEVKNINDNNSNGLKDISNSLKEANDAIDVLLKSGFVYNEEDHTFSRSDEYESARASLSACLSNAFNTMENLSNSNKDASSNLNDDLKNVNNNLKALSNTMVNFADSLTNEKPTFEDVSLKSSEDIVEGKLTKCSNKGSVSGDINVGGIAGAVAKENDLDPEDDFSITGQTSLNMTYKVRAVLVDSVNDGTIFLKKNNAGGIVGNQDLGLIKNNINYGLLDCEDGSYIGGIVGLSLANVNNNYAKCFIYGSDYVGGIVGRGKKLNNNGSLAQIKEATNNVGMIMGGLIGDELAESSDDINGNYYLYGGYGAIDNISYGGKAYPISYDELKDLNIDDSLKKINIYFVNDKECILKETIEYGESLPLSKVPYIDEKDNDYALWEGMSDGVLNNVTRDLLFKCDFNDVYPSISSSEEPLAYVVADGKFFMGDSLSCMVEAKDNNELTYKLNFKLGNSSLCDDLRIYTNSYDKYEVYVNDERVDYKEDGRYCVIAYDNKVDSITVKKLNDYSYLLYCALGGAVVIVTLGIVRRKHKKKK